jgi:hypothetical protein
MGLADDARKLIEEQREERNRGPVKAPKRKPVFDYFVDDEAKAAIIEFGQELARLGQAIQPIYGIEEKVERTMNTR